jgi:hypothetical protein
MPLRCRTAAWARGGVDAVDHRLVADQHGVVVPLLSLVLEPAGAVQQVADGGNAVVAHEGDRGALDVLPRELVVRDQAQDLVEVDGRVELLDAAQVLVAASAAGDRRDELHSPSDLPMISFWISVVPP